MDPQQAQAECLLSVPAAARWLQMHGVQVHENTVRQWITVGRIPTQQAIRRPRMRLIRLSTLTQIAACPYCSAR